MIHPSARGSSVTNTKPSSIIQNEYHFKNLTNLDSLKAPLVRRSETNPQANTDLSLQFCTSSSSIAGGGGEAAGSKVALDNLQIRELLLQDESKNRSLNMMKTQLYRRRAVDVSNVETQKKLKTVPPREQDVLDRSAIDSLSGMSASSNDVARVIGDKMFWKMRTYMIKYVSFHLLVSLKYINFALFLTFVLLICSASRRSLQHKYLSFIG